MTDTSFLDQLRDVHVYIKTSDELGQLAGFDDEGRAILSGVGGRDHMQPIVVSTGETAAPMVTRYGQGCTSSS
jgi:hypothetical protein